LKDQQRRTKEYDALRKELPQIRDGKALHALMHLQEVGSRGTDDDWSAAAVTERYGAEIAAAAAEGFQRVWQTQTPPALRETEANVLPFVCSLGVLGLNLATQQGLDVTQFDEAQLRKAIAYGSWQLNQLPAWLDRCAERAPEMLREIFGPSLHLDHSSEHGDRLLRKLSHASHAVRAACAPLLLNLLGQGAPPRAAVLEQMLQLLQGLTAHADELRALSRSGCEASLDTPERFAMWWRTWLPLDASAAVAFLQEVSSRASRDISDACVLACVAEHRPEELLKPLQGNAGDLLTLLDVVLRHVRPNEDVEDRHNPRHDAQEFRWRLRGAVIETGAPEAIRTLDRLASELWNSEWSKEWLLHAADECAAHAAARQWPVEDVVDLLERGLLIPRTTSDLFEVTLDVLEDIRHYIQLGDTSPRATFCRDDLDEAHFQRLLGKELEGQANGRYTVSREDELADSTRPDLRIRANGLGPVSIEVKIAAGWSLPELEAALATQLVGQYMKDAAARHGVLVLVHSRKPTRTWLASAHRIDGFDALVAHLKARAEGLRAGRADIEGLAVIGIDFHEPRASTTPSNASANQKQKSRQRAGSTGRGKKNRAP
jgi:hypothetical protein